MKVTFVLLLLALGSYHVVSAQSQIQAHLQDVVRVSVGEFRGNLVWQKSTDGVTWADLATGQNSTLEWTVDVLPAFLRARIVEGTCAPIYSGVLTISSFEATLPAVETSQVTAITSVGAITGGNVVDSGGAPVLERGIVLSTQPSPTTSDFVIASGVGVGPFETPLTNLTPNTHYFVRAYAINSAGTSYGSELSFTTPIGLPLLSTTAVTAITSQSASTGGTISSDGGSAISARGVVYGVSPNPTISNSFTTNGTGTGAFASTLSQLAPATLYYVRAYATNEAGTTYGNEVSFTTSIGLPVLTTTAVTAITSQGASTGGTISSDGGSAISARGVVYGVSPNPTLSNSFTTNGTGIGAFASTLSQLTPATLYYVRAYATNAAGTTYGNEVNFATSIVLPSVSTTAVTAITSQSAFAGGTISSDGGSAISARGVVFGVSPNPTLSNSFTANGTGTGAFASTLSQLTPATLYYVRAYATNAAGTAYGNEVSFTTASLQPRVLLFASHEQTYYSELIVMKRALEASGYLVEIRSANAQPASLYLTPYASIQATAEDLPGGSYTQFTSQFQNLFGTAWNVADDAIPTSVAVDGRIQDVTNMHGYEALVIAGGTGALAYRVDGAYEAQGTGDRLVSAQDMEVVANKLNALALDALQNGKPVMAQCHAASLPAFWRVPGTSGSGAEALGFSLLKGEAATGFPEPETPVTLQSLGVTHRSEDRVTVSSPYADWEHTSVGKSKLITTRDWYPQTVVYAAQTLINILKTYPSQQALATSRSILLLHGGAINPSDCLATNRANDVPCNYTNAAEELPADYTQLMTLLADSPADAYTFTVSQWNILAADFPTSQSGVLNLLDDYDAVIFFKHWSTGVTSNLQNALVTYVDNGGGVLALHHGLYNDIDNSTGVTLNKDILVNQLFGAQSAASGWSATRTNFRYYATNYGHFVSTYAVPLTAQNEALQAPAAWQSNLLMNVANTGFSYYPNFAIYDEIYNNMVFVPGQTFGRGVNQITPLFSNDLSAHPSQCHTSGFVKRFNLTGQSIGKVAYLQSGERKESLSQSHPYGQVVRNALAWVAVD